MAHDVSPAATRIEMLIEQLDATLKGKARERVAELVGLILELQGAGVSRMVEIVLATGEASSMLDAFAADPAVATLLASHDLHPHELPKRIEAALATATARLGGRVDARLVSLSEDVARLRVTARGGQAAAPTARIRAVVTEAVEAVAPELDRVLVEVAAPATSSPLVQISRERIGAPPRAGVNAVRLPVVEPASPEAASPGVEAASPGDDAAGATCGRCGEPLPEGHPHLVDVSERRLVCSCRACRLAIEDRGEAGDGSFRAVPPRCSPHPKLRLSMGQWEAFQIPVGLAFFTVHGITGQVHGFYPSPAGAVESLLPLAAWQDLVDDNRWLDSMAPDVEALLVRVSRNADRAAHGLVIPVDRCYELVGRVRVRWSGLDGGEGVSDEIDRFFAEHDPAPSSPAGRA